MQILSDCGLAKGQAVHSELDILRLKPKFHLGSRQKSLLANAFQVDTPSNHWELYISQVGARVMQLVTEMRCWLVVPEKRCLA
jgi:hypothetical protein